MAYQLLVRNGPGRAVMLTIGQEDLAVLTQICPLNSKTILSNLPRHAMGLEDAVISTTHFSLVSATPSCRSCIHFAVTCGLPCCCIVSRVYLVCLRTAKRSANELATS
eukprot:6205619-Pleurochrysis_carterae.AAC.4